MLKFEKKNCCKFFICSFVYEIKTCKIFFITSNHKRFFTLPCYVPKTLCKTFKLEVFHAKIFQTTVHVHLLASLIQNVFLATPCCKNAAGIFPPEQNASIIIVDSIPAVSKMENKPHKV